jgi:hypothetical protein
MIDLYLFICELVMMVVSFLFGYKYGSFGKELLEDKVLWYKNLFEYQKNLNVVYQKLFEDNLKRESEKEYYE